MEIESLRRLSSRDVYRWVTTCDENFCSPRWSEERLSEYVLKLSKNAYFDLLFDNGNKVGFVAYYLNEKNKFAYITMIAVAKEFRGKCYSKILLDSFLSHLSLGIDYVSLEVSKFNISALCLYKKYCFVEVEERGEKIMMKKTL